MLIFPIPKYVLLLFPDCEGSSHCGSLCEIYPVKLITGMDTHIVSFRSTLSYTARLPCAVCWWVCAQLCFPAPVLPITCSFSLSKGSPLDISMRKYFSPTGGGLRTKWKSPPWAAGAPFSTWGNRRLFPSGSCSAMRVSPRRWRPWLWKVSALPRPCPRAAPRAAGPPTGHLLLLPRRLFSFSGPTPDTLQ